MVKIESHQEVSVCYIIWKKEKTPHPMPWKCLTFLFFIETQQSVLKAQSDFLCWTMCHSSKCDVSLPIGGIGAHLAPCCPFLIPPLLCWALQMVQVKKKGDIIRETRLGKLKLYKWCLHWRTCALLHFLMATKGVSHGERSELDILLTCFQPYTGQRQCSILHLSLELERKRFSP